MLMVVFPCMNIVPTVIVENPNIQKIIAEIKVVKWINLNVPSTPVMYLMVIKVNIAPNTTMQNFDCIIENKTLPKVTLTVDDAAEHQAATIVLMDEIGTHSG